MRHKIANKTSFYDQKTNIRVRKNLKPKPRILICTAVFDLPDRK